MNFDINTEQLGDSAYVISLTGEVDLYTAPEFKQQLLEVINQGAKEVVVDFSNTTFIDSTTLGVLVGGSGSARTTGSCRSSRATATSRRSSRSRVDRVFTIYGSRDEAVAGIGSATQPSA